MLDQDASPAGTADRGQEPSLYEAAEVYDAIVAPGPCEAFYREEARRAGGPVLELACGTGRLTLPLARDGHEVVGLDASPAMLAAARRKAKGQGLRLSFVEGDMAGFDLGRRFGLVILSCNSLAHLTRTADLRACLRTVRRHLAPGGRLAFDVALPDPGLLQDGVTRRLDLGPNPASAVEAEETAWYDPMRQIRVARWRVGPPGGPRQDFAPLVLRQFFPREIPLLLELEGLGLEARYGDFARNPLEPWSLNQICVARAA
ncbi:class I SAM-dependent methyltransferase [Rubellimicrobium roseum]|uniref:Class I SAM-dependent methyltransferase n=1 Tax=Rubellimicrobium roseum TaxID=687525 RepID=A0A5C4N8M0_9RHOB|nr:class I SAM-dependent methyltransferase [Rubellimicrobium roseum]TNC70387.1 class I SAM-dependent methyltransferase [Rubellimicrobium roseum]